MRIVLVESKPRRERLYFASDRSGSDRTRRDEMTSEGQSGVRIEPHFRFRSGNQDGSIRFADRKFDLHLGRIEYAHQRTASPELVAFPGMAQRIVSKDVLERNHAVNSRVQFELAAVGDRPINGELLAIPLQFQSANLGELGKIVEVVGLLQTCHVGFCVFELDLILLLIDNAEGWALSHLELGFLQIGSRLNEIGRAFFRVASVLSLLLLDLMSQIIELRAGFPLRLQFAGAIEFSEQVAGANLGTVSNERDERQVAALALDSRHLNHHGMSRADQTRRANDTTRRLHG